MTYRLALILALVALALSELSAQRAPISIGHRRPGGRHIYDRPLFSPWIGADGGFGVPAARCMECNAHFGDFAWMGTIGAGATLFSRLTIGAEQTGMKVPFGIEESSARLRMLTARLGTRFGILGKAGYGKGRYTLGTARLVEDKAAWMAGVETCSLGRADFCAVVDYSQTAVASERTVNGQPVHYRMRALRVGLVLRAHLLKGRHVTLSPRDSTVTRR